MLWGIFARCKITIEYGKISFAFYYFNCFRNFIRKSPSYDAMDRKISHYPEEQGQTQAKADRTHASIYFRARILPLSIPSVTAQLHKARDVSRQIKAHSHSGERRFIYFNFPVTEARLQWGGDMIRTSGACLMSTGATYSLIRNMEIQSTFK